MNELSLFTGAGGGIWGSRLLGWRTIGYVEKDEYCQRVIAQRIRDGYFHEAPIFGDIKAFNDDGYAERYRGLVDIITAGFPCQPFSVAGKQQGADDERNMWPATIDTIRTVQPRFCLLENVPGLITSGYFGTVLGDLAASGYDARWDVLGACDVGAPHYRDRLWVLAHSRGARRRENAGSSYGDESQNEGRGSQEMHKLDGDGERNSQGVLANSDPERRDGRTGNQRASRRRESPNSSSTWWAADPADSPIESRLGRMAHELANRVK